MLSSPVGRTGAKACLLFVDDATGAAVAARFVDQESFFAYGPSRKSNFRAMGTPVACYQVGAVRKNLTSNNRKTILILCKIQRSEPSSRSKLGENVNPGLIQSNQIYRKRLASVTNGLRKTNFI